VQKLYSESISALYKRSMVYTQLGLTIIHTKERVLTRCIPRYTCNLVSIVDMIIGPVQFQCK